MTEGFPDFGWEHSRPSPTREFTGWLSPYDAGMLLDVGKLLVVSPPPSPPPPPSLPTVLRSAWG